MKIASITSFGSVAIITLVCGFALAQHPPGPPPGPAPRGPGGPGQAGGIDGGDGMMEHGILKYLYPIEMIRRHSLELELTNDQVEKLRKVITDVSVEVEQLKWDLNAASRKMMEMLQDSASKEQVYAQMDVVFKFENKIKLKHVGLLIVIRDVLNPKQRKILDGIKAQHEARGPMDFLSPGQGPP